MASPEDAGLRLRSIRTKVADAAPDAKAGKDLDPDDGGTDGAVGRGIREPVSPAGRMFIQPKLNCYIICIVGFKNHINVATFKTGLLQTMVRHKRFSSVMRQEKDGSIYWVRTTVNIDDHIIVPPASAIGMESNRKIEDYAAKLALAPPLDQSRPLWEGHILNVQSADAAASFVFRIHHSLGDGMSLLSLFIASCRRVADPNLLPSVLPPSKNRVISSTKQVTSLYNYISLLWRILIMIWCTIIDVGNFFLILLGSKDSQTPLRGYTEVQGLPKSISTATITFDDISIVKNAVQGSVNDVFLGIVNSGIRRYLQEHSERLFVHPLKHPDSGGLKTSVVMGSRRTERMDDLKIRATCLVNTRRQPGLLELASLMEGRSQPQWGNNIGYVVVPLGVKHYEDPLEYVRKAKKVMARKKCSFEALFTYKCAHLILSILADKAAADISCIALRNTTLSLSNMIGPLEETMFMGNPITYIVPTVFGQPQALCIHLQSYMGKAKLVLSVEKEVITDPDTLLEHIVNSLQDMKAAASRTAG